MTANGTELASIQVIVHGSVQGVFFRDFTCRWAASLGVTGYVQNMPDGVNVAVHAEGERQKLEELVVQLKQGPPGAVVKRVDVIWYEYSGDYVRFNVKY